MLSPLIPRSSHPQPVVAVIGESKGGSEVTDFIVPYSILKRSGYFTVVSVGTTSTTLKMVQGCFSIETDHTITSFKESFPDGADILIVPNQINQKDAILKAFIVDQAEKGAKVVGVCDGVWSLVNAGLIAGKQCTTHWFTRGGLEKVGGLVVKDRRYVDDGNIITTTGVTASIPVSLAIVEAVAGRDAAKRVAGELGAVEWGSEYDSSPFTLGKLVPKIIQTSMNWKKDILGIEFSTGIDELELAVVSDIYNRTGGSKVITYGKSAVIVSKNGLKLIPQEQALPSGSKKIEFVGANSIQVLDNALLDVANRYGKASAARAATEMEYPGMV
ncbi:class I glutamine amidotransferase-like protein [Rhizoclosmatium globosum]|uniref:Class I glutamine amidotransferase-like protein n=1 Tax=Rhizoclosmatium globosum TaxID=329046 RepID=A0A1Y2D2U6_9FUNG|nr:class I glutamine amidotransferase-like protein [Rhizoclosmatium globosum]|eukprot:ORY53436.1 class I glutamine amidotransferase-like protein [Rhizoclosmatium globosum]